jgi:DNA-binding NarL/FixJ family response regulator
VTADTIQVVIADDQQNVRRSLRSILQTQPDIRVTGEAADGVTAIDQCRLLRPDVLLADIRMPRKDGLEVTRALAGPDVTAPTRVVVITTFGLDEYVHAALRNGACGFLLKRARPALLIEGVRAAVAGGMLISPQLTIPLLRHQGRPLAHDRDDHPEPLTDRELDVARLVAQAQTNIEIAGKLFISPGTVKTHIANIQRKLGARNRVSIAAWAWETGQVRS